MSYKVSQNCSERGYVCMEVLQKSSSIMSLRLGRLSRNPEEACHQYLFFDKSIQPSIITSAKHDHRERCPLVGKYAVTSLKKKSCARPQPSTDHVTFGCAAAGATQFSLTQKDCDGKAETSSKIPHFDILSLLESWVLKSDIADESLMTSFLNQQKLRNH